MSKETTLEVLRRAADDYSFLAQMSDDTTQALESDDLPSEERAAFRVEMYVGSKIMSANWTRP